MQFVNSRDGTKIAYDRTGQGPAVIMVNGALIHREFHGGRELATFLSQGFTFIEYDRRGRGKSTDVHPYAVQREIEDIGVLIAAAGGSAFLYGISSGGALALLAAAHLGPLRVTKLALYEPPYRSINEETGREFAREKKRMNELVEKGKPGDAVAFFISSTGTPDEAIDGMRKTPDWNVMLKVEHTLVHDYAIMGDGSVPLDIARTVTIPVLVLDGGKSGAFMHEAADTLAREIPGAQRKTLENQTHAVSPAALAPVLAEFFNSDG